MMRWLLSSLAMSATLSAGAPLVNQEKAARLVLLDKSIVTLEGDSTLHAFTSKTSTFILTATLTSKAPTFAAIWAEITSQKALSSLTLALPVTSLHADTSGLDENLYKELKAHKHPEIIFTLHEYEFQTNTRTLVLAGDLTVAGTSKRVKFSADATVAGEIIQIKGKTVLAMSEFNIDPPTMMFGMVKVTDKITINFDMYLALRP